MKGFLVLLCALAAVQGRSTGVETSNRQLAVPGQNPSLVHLRIAVATSGFLQTCAGSLIDQSWVLTTADCLNIARFVWIRYGVVRVINPELVTESSAVRVHPAYNANTGVNNIALVSINRVVQSTNTIAPVALSRNAALPESANFCAWGEDTGAPGEVLECYDVTLQESNGRIVAQSEDGAATRFDSGAPLISDGVQIAYLVSPAQNGNAGTFIRPDVNWIRDVTNLDL